MAFRIFQDGFRSDQRPERTSLVCSSGRPGYQGAVAALCDVRSAKELNEFVQKIVYIFPGDGAPLTGEPIG